MSVHASRGHQGCSGSLNLTASRGSFSDGDGNYLTNSDCRFVIRPTLERINILLVFSLLELLDENDRVFVHDGDSIDAPQLGTFTGSTLPRSLTSSGGALTVRFVTDASGDAGRGFEATYQVQDIAFQQDAWTGAYLRSA